MKFPHHFATISLTVAGIALVLAFLLKWKTLNKISFLIPWLLMLAGIGAAGAFLTSWAHSVAGWTTSGIPVAGAIIVKAAAVALLYIVGYDLWPRHDSNKTTEISAFLLPAFGPEIGGMVGAMLATGLSWIESVGSFAIAGLFGG